MPETAKPVDVLAARLVLAVVVMLNTGYAFAHEFQPNTQLLTALLVCGGYVSGRTIDSRRRIKRSDSEDANA